MRVKFGTQRARVLTTVQAGLQHIDLHDYFRITQLTKEGSMNIKPLHDRVVLKRMEEEKMSAGGIVIPDAATEKPIKGEVIAVGAGKSLDNGSVRAPAVKVGDKVLFGKYAGTEVKLDGTEYLVVKEDDIFAILD